MTKEEKDLLLSLLEKANDNDMLFIYDGDENEYAIEWAYIDYGKICIRIK